MRFNQSFLWGLKLTFWQLHLIVPRQAVVILIGILVMVILSLFLLLALLRRLL